MEWSRAKKYTIIMLVILNIVLLCLNIYKSFDTRLGSGRISAVRDLLEKENITIATTLPRNYIPMSELTTTAYNFDYIKLEKIFMENEENVKRTDEYNSVVFISDISRLSIRGGSINFTTSYSEEITSNTVARNYTDNIINRINDVFGNYSYHSMSNNDNGFTIKYYEKVDGANVFSNFAYFTIKGNNIALALNYVDIGNETGKRETIYAADEALFAAANKIKEESNKTNISNVELGYYVMGSNTGGEDYAVPFYMIVGNGKEYYVNAYTGEYF